jgi:hypothetical protein
MKGSAGYLKADALIDSSITLMTAAEVCTAAHKHISSTCHASLTGRLTSVCAQAGIAGDEGDIPEALVRPVQAEVARSCCLLSIVCCRAANIAYFLLAPNAYRGRGKATSRISFRT